MKGNFIQFGAGNIGRSFIAPIFANAGYNVTFIDVDKELVRLLNERGSYPVYLADDDSPETITVTNVSAIDGNDVEAVVEAIASADIAATAVGANALKYLYENIAAGIVKRNGRPLDIILAENLRSAANILKQGVSEYLPNDIDVAQVLGAIETSIGKMSPLLTAEQKAKDPLLVCAEKYNTLILDKLAFLNPIPDVKGLYPTPYMTAYVDRKLYIHNLGHATVAYLAYKKDKNIEYIWQALDDKDVYDTARKVMTESGAALVKTYSDAFSAEQIMEHIDDLLKRMANKALMDTVYRVGRDLKRKLSHEDRIIGAMTLAIKADVDITNMAMVARAALDFTATDESGNMFAPDVEVMNMIKEKGHKNTLIEISNLDINKIIDKKILEEIMKNDN